MNDEELGQWALSIPQAHLLEPVAASVARLLIEAFYLRSQLLIAAQRISAQSELLSKKAEPQCAPAHQEADLEKEARELAISFWGTREQRDELFAEKLRKQGWLKPVETSCDQPIEVKAQ